MGCGGSILDYLNGMCKFPCFEGENNFMSCYIRAN